ncbi:acetate--CoA ligase family protein [Thermodesulfobacteriota bacterium]
MDAFFNPKAIAVVGASKNGLGYFVILNLIDGFKGKIYPVNQNYEEIEGLTCFSSLEHIKGPVDLAIILVPASSVPSVLEACSKKGIGHVIIESAGFSETGDEGIELQKHCNSIAEKTGMRIWGPNCMGVVDVPNKHYFTFMHPGVRAEGLLPGRISLIVQSGMMSAIFLAELGRREIGISKACSIGNRADVDECDVIRYLLDDPDTDVIALYLESIPRGRLLAQIAQASKKPILLLKGGKSEAGAKAAKSHTYSLSGNSRLLESVMDISGVIMADEIYQMMDMANALADITHLNPACRTAIITLSGGAGILACDALEMHGLPIAELSEQAKKEIGEVFPSWMPVSNPVDLFPAMGVSGRKAAFRKAFSAAMKDPNVDVLLVHYVAGLDKETPDLELLKQQADHSGKVIIFWLMGRRAGREKFRQEAKKFRIIVHDNASRIAECLIAASRFRSRRPGNKTGGIESGQKVKREHQNLPFPSGEKILDEFDSKQILAEWKIPVVDERLIMSMDEAWKCAQEMGPPVVMKGLVPGQAHKTEQGLVHLGLTDRSELESAFDSVNKGIENKGRILIQKQVKLDYELIAGFMLDNEFGPCVMFGLGGIFSELDPDVVFAMAPLKRDAALKLMGRIRGKKLFGGFRGLSPLDEDAVTDLLVNLGNLGISYPQIEQIDINPIVVSKGSPLAVDANIVLNNK